MNSRRHALAISMLMAAVPTVVIAAGDAANLPGGASSVVEAHGDWTTRCGAAGKSDTAPGGVQCAVTQQQLDQKTHQRILTLAVNPMSSGGVKGVLIMPFGLALDSGVTLKIDNGPETKPLRFKTCLPAGCLVPLEWPDATVKDLRNAKVLTITAQSDRGGAAPFAVSLNGFGGAFDRAIELTPKQ